MFIICLFFAATAEACTVSHVKEGVIFHSVNTAMKPEVDMNKSFLSLLVFVILVSGCSHNNSVAPTCTELNTTQYLAFQLFISGTTEPTADYKGLNNFISAEKMEEFFMAVHSEIGTSSTLCRKPAIIIGPIALDFSNAAITDLINQSFQLAAKYDIAVGFHVDDGMFWANRTDLWQNPENVEWIDWDGTPNTSRYVDWIPPKLAPLMCFNAPLVKSAVADFITNIAASIKANLNQLPAEKQYLYAATILGWETSIDPDRDTQKASGYHALFNKGFTSSNLPADIDQARVDILHEYIEWMGKSFSSAGFPVTKTYSHIVFITKHFYDSLASINPAFASHSYAEANNFSLPEVAVGSDYMPGFSTYPLSGILDEIHSVVKKSIWASSEGTNMIPFNPPVTTGYGMESYLARNYNHGCKLVTIFAFHLRGDPFTNALNDASEGTDAITVYKKFLNGDSLIE